jgi:hypothetical protein
MKYIKKFETVNDIEDVDFKVGDYVYVIDNSYNQNMINFDKLKLDKRYQILSIEDGGFTKKPSSTNPSDVCDVGTGQDFNLKRFMSEEEYQSIKYNL